MAMKILGQIEETFGKRLRVSSLLPRSTVRQQASLLGDGVSR
jgi:hypothetical protein